MTEHDHLQNTSDATGGAVKSTDKYDDERVMHHDAYLKPSSPSLMSLAQRIFEQTEDIRSTGTKKKPRRDAVARRKALTFNLVANLAALHEVKDFESYIALPMRQLKRSRYDRPDFHIKMLREQVELLVVLGWIVRKEAVYKKLRTTIWPSKIIWAELSQLGDGPHVGREDGGESIVLRTKSEDDRSKPLIDYKDTEETDTLRAEMDIFNETIKNADIQFDGKRIGWTYLVRNFQNRSLAEPHCFNRVGEIERRLLDVATQGPARLHYAGWRAAFRLGLQVFIRSAGISRSGGRTAEPGRIRAD